MTLAPAAGGLALFPNPIAGGATTLVGANAGARVQMLDALGRVVTTATADAAGTAHLTLPVGVASGVYVVRTEAQGLRLLVK
ncbi:MAG: T9SS type A sorting domain-containing protein [Janthinobacterium lividum]